MMGTDTERRQLENRSDQSDDLDSSNENYSSTVVALPGDTTELILNKLDPVSFHCFGSVCSRLHSITIAAKKRLKPQLPWLMYNSCSGSDQLPNFFSLSGHGKLSRPKLVEACGIRCCGSSWGWLIMADERSCNNNNSTIIFLLNPFTKIQIQLPTQAMAIVDDLDSSNENYSSMVVALPGDITEFMILTKLDPVSFHCFGSVCRRLHSITIAAKKRLKPQLPWLMYNSCSGSDQLPKFFSLSGHGKLSRPKLVEACGIRCCGSSWGWLIMADERSCNNNNSTIIFLLNPFTRIQIQLPTQVMAIWKNEKVSVTIPPSHHIRKALLLSPPTSNSNLSDIDMDCVVVLISFAFDLYFCRLGDEEWSTRILWTKFEDIILYHGQVYAITSSYDLVRVDLEGLHPKVISCDIAPPPPRDPEISEDGRHWCQFWCTIADSSHEKAVYLVESLGGELLMVIRRLDISHCSYRDALRTGQLRYGLYPRTRALRVFRLDTEGQCWTQMENLLHQMLFVGSGNAIALSALHYPNFTSGNCIYFTQQNFYPLRTKTVPPACQDTGVFHLEDKSIKPLFLDDDHDDDVTPPLIWFTPFSTS